jgi:hypothetical protein
MVCAKGTLQMRSCLCFYIYIYIYIYVYADVHKVKIAS